MNRAKLVLLLHVDENFPIPGIPYFSQMHTDNIIIATVTVVLPLRIPRVQTET